MSIVQYQGYNWDGLICIDIDVQKNEKGFYCSICEEDKREYFQTEKELYTEHSFKDFLELSNETISENSFLAIYGDLQNYSYAKIVNSLKDLEEEKLVAVLSLKEIRK